MFLNFTFKDIKNNWAQQRVHRMPQGWSIRKLSCFKLPLSGGYGNRPEPTGHATYPQPLYASVKPQNDTSLRTIIIQERKDRYQKLP